MKQDKIQPGVLVNKRLWRALKAEAAFCGMTTSTALEIAIERYVDLLRTSRAETTNASPIPAHLTEDQHTFWEVS